MATLDDKLLGEKLQNYCSSSSSEEEGTIEIKFFGENKISMVLS
jgi:hypothetical protein